MNPGIMVLLISASLVNNVIGAFYSEADYSDDEVPGLAVPFSDDDGLFVEASDPAPCCFPDQWQGIATAQIGAAKTRERSKLIQSNTTLYIDSKNYRIAGKVLARNDTINFVLLFNNSANTSTLYAYNNATQKCAVKNLKKTVWRKQCLPPNSTYLGKITLGPAQGGLSANLYKFRGHATAHGKRALVAGTIMVSPQSGTTCLPILIEDHGLIIGRGDEVTDDTDHSFNEILDSRPHPRPRPQTTAFVVSEYFSSVVPSIKDQTVFNIPSFCKNSSTIEDTMMFESQLNEQFPIILERFVEFY